MIQQGQVFKLKATGGEGGPLWAYRYGSQGAVRRDCKSAGSPRRLRRRGRLGRAARLLPGGRAMTLTMGEWVEEYLDTHQGERVTIAKLRWLLRKATAALGEVRLAESRLSRSPRGDSRFPRGTASKRPRLCGRC